MLYCPAVNAFRIVPRLAGRLRREVESSRHLRRDLELLRRYEDPARVEADMGRQPGGAGGAAMAGGAGAPSATGPTGEQLPGGTLLAVSAERCANWCARHPEWPARALAQAGPLLADRITIAGTACELAHPGGWNRDPASGGEWPLRPHRKIRLDDPSKPADVRFQWEPGRFHHALLLGRAYVASGDPAHPEAFLRQVDSFMQGNPPFRSIHWAVGMEVAIRAAAWVCAIDFMKHAPAIALEADRLRRLLYLHGLFLEHHIEQHPLGFTTNHTLADYAGLAVLGRVLAGAPAGERWLALAGDGLEQCLGEQVLAGGAHAEGSLPYERFVLETAVVGALCLERRDRDRVIPAIHALAGHLRGATLPSGLPFVGDGDDSFFPPFALAPFDDCDPLDPEPVLQVAAWLCDDPSLPLRGERQESAFWLGVDAPLHAGSGSGMHGGTRAVGPTGALDARPVPPGRGFIRFTAGPFEGLLIGRGAGASSAPAGSPVSSRITAGRGTAGAAEQGADGKDPGHGDGWLPTHGHNDLLSLVLDAGGQPLLIDPGTGVYALDRNLRHQLRSTAAHSTLQVDGLEQSPIHPARAFEGPGAVACGLTIPDVADAGQVAPRSVVPVIDIGGWHDGFGTIRHARRIFWRRECLWIEDLLFRTTSMKERSASGAEVTSTLRFRLAEGLDPRRSDGTSSRPCIEVSLASGPGHRLPGEVAELAVHRGAPAAHQRKPGAVNSSGAPASVPAAARAVQPSLAFPVSPDAVELSLLRPRGAQWRHEAASASRRYGRIFLAPVLSSVWQGPLPHRWLTVMRFRPGRA